MAVQLAHDASGEDSELKGVGGVGPGGTQGPGGLTQLLKGCVILGCYIRPACKMNAQAGV